MKLILYSKPGCHLCEGLEEKLEKIQDIHIDLEIRNITTNDDWWAKYQYEIPVLYIVTENQAKLIPRFSPRISVEQLSKTLQKYQ
jgi:hypothetical protein